MTKWLGPGVGCCVGLVAGVLAGMAVAGHSTSARVLGAVLGGTPGSVLGTLIIMLGTRWCREVRYRRNSVGRLPRPPDGPAAGDPGAWPIHGRLAEHPSGKLWKSPGAGLGEWIAGPDDDAPMRWVKEGPFTMGSDSGRPEEAPAHAARFRQGFWIHERLVTNAQYARYLNERVGKPGADPAEVSRDPVLTCSSSEIYWDGAQYAPREGRGHHPVIGADWKAACDYARQYGLRLPTEAEWEYAARGSDGRTYPWGKRWRRDRCCMAEKQGEEYRAPARPGLLPRVTRTMPVGSFPAGRSPCQALDMAGNLMEWCEDWYDPDWYRRTLGSHDVGVDLCGPPSSPSGDRVVRGGNWYYGREYCRTYHRHCTKPGNSDNSVGFRCVYQDPNWPALSAIGDPEEKGER